MPNTECRRFCLHQPGRFGSSWSHSMRRASAKLMPSRCSSYEHPHTHRDGVRRLATTSSLIRIHAHTLVRKTCETRAERGLVGDRNLYAIRRVPWRRVILGTHKHFGSVVGQESLTKLAGCPPPRGVEHRDAGNPLQTLRRHRRPHSPRCERHRDDPKGSLFSHVDAVTIHSKTNPQCRHRSA